MQNDLQFGHVEMLQSRPTLYALMARWNTVLLILVAPYIHTWQQTEQGQ